MHKLAILLVLALPVTADEFSDAFKSLKVPKAARIEKDLAPQLPRGVVIEAGPFDRIIQSLLAPHAKRLEQRERLMPRLTTRQLGTAFKVMAKENADRRKRIAAVERSYAEHYNKGFDQRSAGDKRARMLASVLLPYYRTLLLRNARIAALAKPEAILATASDPALRAAAVRAADNIEVVKKSATDDKSEAVRAEALLALLRFKVSAIKGTVLAALGDPSWRVRALAVAICVRARLVEAAGALIDALAKEDGRLRKDIDDALFALTGTRLYGDVDLWRSWWSSNQERIAREAKALADAGEYDKILGGLERGELERGDESKRKGGTSAFYGIPTVSKRVVFVIDISRSMQDAAQAKPAATTGRKKSRYPAPAGNSKLDIAKWQLHRAIESLPKDAVFGIVVYSESYAVWANELSAASSRNKKKAHSFVDDLRGNGTTNIADSLDKAMELAPDTIYLLSDGDPNRGRVSKLDALLEEILERNVRKRLVVHAVGIGEAAGSTFLERLAKATGGLYVGFK
ncbi:MAG: VWA domain-containing protein [Planctomycetota bacterium]